MLTLLLIACTLTDTAAPDLELPDLDTDTDRYADPPEPEPELDAHLASCPTCTPEPGGLWRFRAFPPSSEWVVEVGSFIDDGAAMVSDAPAGISTAASLPLPLPVGGELVAFEVEVEHCLTALIRRDPPVPQVDGQGGTAWVSGGNIGPINPLVFDVNHVIEPGVAYDAYISAEQSCGLITFDVIFSE